MKTMVLTCAALSALALALALTACQPAANAKRPDPAPASEQTAAQVPAEAPNYDEPLTTASMAGCEVVLQLADNAVATGALQADRPAIAAARAKYQTQLEAAFSEDERAQLVGSTVAFYDQLTPAQLKSSADVCLAAQDRHFTAEDG